MASASYISRPSTSKHSLNNNNLTRSQVDRAMKDINYEKKLLESCNDELARTIASTQALKSVKKQLERTNRALKNRLTAEKNSTMDLEDVNKLYDAEILRLTEYLEILREKEKTANFELSQCQHDRTNAITQLTHVEERLLSAKSDAARSQQQARNAALQKNRLNHEIEHLQSVLYFNKKLHTTEINNLNAQLLGLDGIVNEEESYNPDRDDHVVDIKRILNVFKIEYQDILDRSFEQEKNDLIIEKQNLERLNEEMDKNANGLKMKIAVYIKELQKLNDNLSQLDIEASKLKKEASGERIEFEQKRSQILIDVKETTEKSKIAEIELDRLIREDNSAIKLIIQLQLEINAYRTLMNVDCVVNDIMNEDYITNSINIPLSEIKSSQKVDPMRIDHV